MITDALAAYLRAHVSLAHVYVNRAPLDAAPCIVIDDNGDDGDRHWMGGAVSTGLKSQEYEITVWADLSSGGPRHAAGIADELVSLLDNFAGPMVDTSVSPNVTHKIAGIRASNGGGDFDAGPKNYGHSVFLTVTYK